VPIKTALLRKRLLQVLSYFAAWTLVAFFLATQGATRALYSQRSVDWRHVAEVWLTDAYMWSLLAPLVWLLSERIQFRRRHWGLSLVVHLACGPVFALAQAALFSLTSAVFGLPIRPGFAATFLAVLPFDFHSNLTIYWLIVGIQHTTKIYRDYREKETRAAQLELRTSELQTQLVKSNLSALRMQLRPHFLFNTLNAIVVLVRQGKTLEADMMLTHLSELLRRTLDEWEVQEISLRRELEFVGLYLDIERVRFKDRMAVEIAAAPETMEALVPCFLLQPVIENAIRHGIAVKAAPGNIVLRSRITDSMLELQVCDDGPGAPSTESERSGVGLSNTRARLQQLYGELQSVELQSSGVGTIATIRIPYHSETRPLECQEI
jgi:two-component system LytT family sensor kinase